MSKLSNSSLWITKVVVFISLSAVTSCAVVQEPPTSATDVPEARRGTGYLIGYLSQVELPRSSFFLPSAPQAEPAGSTDQLATRQALLHRNSAKWDLAIRDADLRFPPAAQAFACALGFEPTESRTPHLVMLLRRTMADAVVSTFDAKNKFQRRRPFAEYGEPSCTPHDEDFLKKDGSYPSGHAAAGWAWALLLAELAPMRQDAILRRGYEFGQSRVVCGVHWPSDIDAGRAVGAAVIATLRNNPTFRRQAQLAMQEVADAYRSKPLATPTSCALEDAAR